MMGSKKLATTVADLPNNVHCGDEQPSFFRTIFGLPGWFLFMRNCLPKQPPRVGFHEATVTRRIQGVSELGNLHKGIQTDSVFVLLHCGQLKVLPGIPNTKGGTKSRLVLIDNSEYWLMIAHGHVGR